MHSFRRRHGQLTCTFEGAELTILSNLSNTLVELLRSEAMPPMCHSSLTGAQDNSTQALFDELESQLGYEGAEDFANNPDIDPVLRRLFPDAYVNDPQASAEFRRFSQSTERDEKMDAVVAVMSDLHQVTADGRCTVADDHVDDWLKTLTALRLGVAARLDIQTAIDADDLAELPDDDPRTAVFSIYEWLGWVQESLLDCLQ